MGRVKIGRKGGRVEEGKMDKRGDKCYMANRRSEKTTSAVVAQCLFSGKLKPSLCFRISITLVFFMYLIFISGQSGIYFSDCGNQRQTNKKR